MARKAMYSPEVQERAVRLVLEQRREHRSLGASIHAGIGMPQLLSVGQDYHQGGIASFGINPGVGSGGAYKEARVNALEPSGQDLRPDRETGRFVRIVSKQEGLHGKAGKEVFGAVQVQGGA